MKVELLFPASDGSGRAYMTWRPVKARVRLIDAPNDPAHLQVRFESRSNVGGGAVLFAAGLTHNGSDSIDLDLPTSGDAVDLWIGGKFGNPSSAFGDVSIEAVRLENGHPAGPSLGRFQTMVRIRKNAEALSVAERDRFLAAMATLNGQGVGRFADFRNMHNRAAYAQIHQNISFLPWHRAYLLDFERELQAIDPQVSLPYWKFDEAAPKLFQPSFMGQSVQGAVRFSSGNPLRTWSSDGVVPLILRGDRVKPTSVINVRDELDCMALSEGPNANYLDFCDWRYNADGNPTGLESDPHNGAHSSHGTGWITDPTTSQFDPLFYLLHNNVDRLWAKWQWLPSGSGGARSDPAAAISYFNGPPQLNGHNRTDTMWPWDGITQGQVNTRPPTAPGGGLTSTPMTPAPGLTPRIDAMIDYLGAHGEDHLGFAYDDVPFEL